MSAEKWKNTQYANEKLFGCSEISQEESQQLYKDWAQSGTYDQLLHGKPSDYNALNQLTNCLRKLFPNPGKVRVLDVGAGTGLTGLVLRDLGFANIDGLEPLDEFANSAKAKGIYKNVITEFIGSETPLNIPDGTYDAVVSTGAFGPGHVPCKGVEEMIRLLKPGGYMANCLRYEFLETCTEYNGKLEPMLNKLEAAGKIKKIHWDCYENHFVNKQGLLMVYQAC